MKSDFDFIHQLFLNILSDMKEILPAPYADFFPGDMVDLHFKQTVPGDDRFGFVPFYHFRIVEHGTLTDSGHINLRIGYTPHIEFCAGHIGYEIKDEFRGHSYAYQACCALIPFIRTKYEWVIITTDPGNEASIKTIEKLGAQFLGITPIPMNDPNYARGSRIKRRYKWHLQ